MGRAGRPGHALSEGIADTGRAPALRPVSDRYVAFEERARAARRGLWKGQFAAPWAWRASAAKGRGREPKPPEGWFSALPAATAAP